jgi:hypothetical protein
MTAQAKTPDIAAGVARIGNGTGAPALQPDARQEVNPARLTCTWVRTDDGDLVMRWTVQTPEDANVLTPEDAHVPTPEHAQEEMTKTAA